jgi:hypothetical protein
MWSTVVERLDLSAMERARIVLLPPMGWESPDWP